MALALVPDLLYSHAYILSEAYYSGCWFFMPDTLANQNHSGKRKLQSKKLSVNNFSIF